MGVTFGELTMDPATYMVHVDVTVNIPFANTKLIPFLQVGPTFNLPTPTYTTSTAGATAQDSVPCVQNTVPMTMGTDYSCAPLSRNDLFPYNCSATPRTPPVGFTLSQLQAQLSGVTDNAYFNGPSITETTMGASGAFVRDGVTHYHYDVRSGTVNGTLYPLYCGECLLNPTECTTLERTTARCSNYTQLKYAPVNGGRMHVAKIVPYMTYPSATKMTYHFQYATPQLFSDCKHNGVGATLLYDQTVTRVIGTRTSFSLGFGYVYQSFTTVTDTRQYQVSTYTSSSLNNDVMFSVLYMLNSQYLATLTLCENPTPIYVNRTWAQLPYCYVISYMNVGTAGATIGPRILDNADGTQYGDVSTVVLPNNLFGSTLQSITPGFDPATNTARVFCPASGTKCTYVFRFLTAPRPLNALGTAFVAPARTSTGVGQYGPFDVAFPPYECSRATPRTCSLVIPNSIGNQTLYDTFLVTLIKNVYPDYNASYVFSSRLDVFTQDAITYPNLLEEACATNQDPTATVICATEPRSKLVTPRGSSIAVYLSLANPNYWNNSFGVEEIDPNTIVFTVYARRPSGNDIQPLVFVISASANAATWIEFKKTWTYGPRINVRAGEGVMSPLVAATYGIDSIHVDYTKFFFFLVAQYGLQYTDFLDTLSVSAYVRYRHIGEVSPARRLLTADVNLLPVTEGVMVASSQSYVISLSRFELVCTSPTSDPILCDIQSSRNGIVTWNELFVLCLAAFVVFIAAWCAMMRCSVSYGGRHARRVSGDVPDELDEIDSLVDTAKSKRHPDPFRVNVRSRTNTPLATGRTLKGGNTLL
jgi:hypothetical protein